MTTNIEQYLADLAQLADQNPVKRSGSNGLEQRRIIAEAALPALIDGIGFSLHSAAELVGHDERFINGVSTLMGRGNRKDGPQCWTRNGMITACQSNIVKLLPLVSDQFRSEFLSQEDIRTKMEALPATQ
jgi:hypothetical protein